MKARTAMKKSVSTLAYDRDEDRLHSAVHEAAHAVASVSVGKPLRFVTIKPLPRHHVGYHPRSTRYTHCDAVAEGNCTDASFQGSIFVALVGLAAEMAAFPDTPESIVAGEMAQVKRLLSTYSWRSPQWTPSLCIGLLQRREDRAQAFVEAEADCIERVAQALLTHDILTGTEVRELVTCMGSRFHEP
jgi:hypothetical protein